MALPPYLREVEGEEDPPEPGAEEEPSRPPRPKVKWLIPNSVKWAGAIIAALISVAYLAISDRIDDVKTDVTNLKTDVTSASDRMEGRIGDVETKLEGRIHETRQDLREDIRNTRTDLKGEISGVRQDIQGLRDDIQGLRQDRR